MIPQKAAIDQSILVNIALSQESYFTVKVKKKMILTGEG